MCAAEGLMIVSLSISCAHLNSSVEQGGSILQSSSPANVTEIINAIQAYNDTIKSSKWLVQPTMNLRSESSPLENADEVIIKVFY